MIRKTVYKHDQKWIALMRIVHHSRRPVKGSSNSDVLDCASTSGVVVNELNHIQHVNIVDRLSTDLIVVVGSLNCC